MFGELPSRIQSGLPLLLKPYPLPGSILFTGPQTDRKGTSYFLAGVAPYVCPGKVTWRRMPSGSKNSLKVPCRDN
jgi:hypothetical protein